MIGSSGRAGALVGRVAAYSGRVRDAVLEQHPGESVCSPLGVWLLLCACLLATEPYEGGQLEAIVGCSRAEAGMLLDAFLSDVPPALHTAIALWAREALTTEQFRRWRDQLPSGVDRGPIPTQAEADAWSDRHTLGMIPTFPGDVARFDLILASALATEVSWDVPYKVGRVSEWFSRSSPWARSVERVLWKGATSDTALVDTEAAGIVAVHEAASREGIVVICVCAHPDTARADAFAAAHEVARHVATGSGLRGVSLFDVPLGDGHSWTITERERAAFEPGQRFEAVTDVALPAWEIRSELSLLASPVFGAAAGLDVLAPMLVEPGPSDARQVALATFDRYGFKAAAVTFMATTAMASLPPEQIGIERVASVRLDHPFAAIAVVGRHPAGQSRFAGLPVFEAWVQSPVEVPEDNAGSTAQL